MDNYKPRLLNMNILPGQRVLVTSDIHGEIEYLKNGLDIAGFCKDDLLVIAGDIVERGSRSLETLRYVMELSENDNVIVLAGNVDLTRLNMLENVREGRGDEMFSYIVSQRKRGRECLFDEMAGECGVNLNAPDDIIKFKPVLLKHFRTELEFLRNLPTLLETQNYIFVHGGIPGGNLKGLCLHNYFEFLKYDRFMETDNCFEKYVVVGHWPVCLYDNSKQNFNPIFDRRRKIISIDGGCGLKKYGQLNIIAIPDIGCGIDEIVTYSYDGLPAVIALEDQRPSEESLFIKWGDNTINKLGTQGDFTYAEHQSTGKKLWIHNDFIYGEHYCNDYTDYVLPVNSGEKLSFIKNTSRGCIVKKDGVVGWYFGRFRPIE